MLFKCIKIMEPWDTDNSTTDSLLRDEADMTWRSPDLMSDREILKEQFYMKQFLYHLQSSSNLPTLSNPELLSNIHRENERLQKELDSIRAGKREEILRKRLESLGKDAEAVMLRMKEFKVVREQEKNQLRELTAKAAARDPS